MVLLVFDGAEALTEQDRRVSDELWAMGFGGSHDDRDDGQKVESDQDIMQRRPVIVVINKTDSRQYIEMEEIRRMWPDVPFVATSTITGEGLSALEAAIVELVMAGKTVQSEGALVTSARHAEALRRAAEHIRASLVPLRDGLPLDFVSIDLRAAYGALGEVTGETASDDLLERIFSEFCIGK